MEDEGSSNTGSPVGDAHESTGTPRGTGRRVAERPVVPEKPGNAGGGKGREEGRHKGEGLGDWLCLTTDYMPEIPEASQAKEPGRKAGVVEA